MAVLAGVDFFTVEVLTLRGLSTYYVLFFLHRETRRVSLAGITRHPTETWMEQMARNAIDEESGYLRQHRYLLHDRDTKFCASFRDLLATGKCEVPCATAAQSESECIRRTLGTICKAGMPLKADSVRGRLAAARWLGSWSTSTPSGIIRVKGTFSYFPARTEPLATTAAVCAAWSYWAAY